MAKKSYLPCRTATLFSPTLANSRASGSSGSVIFDGRDDSGEALRIGIYIIFLESINKGSGVVENMKTVVVSRKL